MTYKLQNYNIYKKVVIMMMIIIKTAKTIQLYYKVVMWRAEGGRGEESVLKKKCS